VGQARGLIKLMTWGRGKNDKGDEERNKGEGGEAISN
jgi:hypothetical protein